MDHLGHVSGAPMGIVKIDESRDYKGKVCMETWQWLALCCVVPTVVLLAMAAFAVWNFTRFLNTITTVSAPDTEALHKQYEKLKAEHPKATQQQLTRKIINRFAFRQGLVGAVTGVGGFLALPIGLTVDLAYSARSNSALSFFIAQLYGIESQEEALNLAQLLVLRREKVNPDELVLWQEQFAGLAYQQLARTVLLRTVSKVIPFAGAITGFLVNYSSAQIFGSVADQYYRGNIDKLTSQVSRRLGTA